jgi:tetratricopeptide (TPR) repeat protein
MNAFLSAVCIASAALLAGCASYKADVNEVADNACVQAQTADDLIKACNIAIEDGYVADYRADAVYNSRGLGYLIKKEYDLALADFEKAISYGGREPVLYSNRGDAYLGKKDYGRAIADFDQAIQMSNGGWPEVYIRRGLAFLWQREDSKALDNFDRAVEMGRNGYANAFMFRALGRFAVQDYAGASADFRKVLDLEPEAVAADDGLCRTLAFEGRTYEAIGHCERAIKAAKQPEGTLFARGYVKLRNGDWKAALSDCEESARLSPVPAMPLFCSAYAHERLGDTEAAKSGYAAARAADPKVDEAMKRLGILPGTADIRPGA